MSNKKILFFAPSATINNPSMCPFITQRIFELQKQGYSVTVLQHGRLITNIKNYINIKNIIKSFIFHGKKRLYKNSQGQFYYYENLMFLSQTAFYKWFKKNKYFLIHAHFVGCGKTLPALKLQYNIPYIITIHGSDMHELTPYDSNAVEDMISILSNANACIFVSNFLLNHAQQLGYKGEKNYIINNGIKFDNFFPKKNLTSENKITLIFVGHPIFIKRVYILPIVLKLVQKKFPNTKLIILGSDNNDLIPYLKYKTWKLKLTNDISFISEVSPEKVGDYMRKSDVLLLPSYNEGFACVAIEAQACGLGVIGAFNGGIPEAVGNNGICVPDTENFINDFANAIIRWLQESHDSEVISNSVRKYSWDIIIKKEIEIYNNI